MRQPGTCKLAGGEVRGKFGRVNQLPSVLCDLLKRKLHRNGSGGASVSGKLPRLARPAQTSLQLGLHGGDLSYGASNILAAANDVVSSWSGCNQPVTTRSSGMSKLEKLPEGIST